MVKALHRAGIEVILDVVYNHTAEGDADGTDAMLPRPGQPCLLHARRGPRRNTPITAASGNTLNANQPIVRRMILDSLRYWVAEMHVDGFRFDLASVLARDETGHPLANPPILWDIESDPVLAGTKLIAEAWDAAGLYQVGSFVGDSWKEWNGRFRDDVRALLQGRRRARCAFWRTAGRQPGHLRARGTGARAKRQFRDLSRRLHAQRSGIVQRQAQRGEWRGQPRRGGRQPVLELRGEGPTDEPAVEKLRNQQVKNFLRHPPVSLGAPMFADGRRDAADPARQQQRLLPG